MKITRTIIDKQEVEIYFGDLKPEVQEKLKEFEGFSAFEGERSFTDDVYLCTVEYIDDIEDYRVVYDSDRDKENPR